MSYDAIFSNMLRTRHLTSHQYSSIASSKFILQVSRSVRCEILAKLQTYSKNNLKTFYWLSVKGTEQFIHNIIRLLVEKSMSWLEFFKNYYISSFVALEYHKCPDLQIQMSIVRAEKFVCLQTWLLNMASRM